MVDAGDSQTHSAEAHRRTLDSHESPRSTIQQSLIEQDAEPNYEYGDAAPDDYAYEQISPVVARRKLKYSLSQDDDRLSPQRERKQSKKSSRRASIDAHRCNSIKNYYRRESIGNSPVKNPKVLTKRTSRVSFADGDESVKTTATDSIGSPSRPTKSAIKKTTITELIKDGIDYGYALWAPDLDYSEPEEGVEYGYGLGVPDGPSNTCAPSSPQREPERRSKTPIMPRRRPSLEEVSANEQAPTLPTQHQETRISLTRRRASFGSSPMMGFVGGADSSTSESVHESAAFRWKSEPVNKKPQDRIPSGPNRRPSLESESMPTHHCE